jgi:hypothetical protein
MRRQLNSSSVDHFELPDEVKKWHSDGNWPFVFLAFLIIIFGAGNDVAGTFDSLSD